MDYKEILRGVLANAYKMADGEVSELLEKTDVAEITNTILEKDKSRISDLGKTKFQDGYKKAKGEALTDFEKSLREKYKVSDETLQGESLIETILADHVTEATKGIEGKKGAITDDEIKKHPLYLKLESDKSKAIADNTKEWEDKLKEAQKGFEKANIFSTVKDKALSMLSGDNYVFPDDAEIATNQKQWFLNDLKGFDFETADGVTYPIKDGKRIEDAHGHAVTLDEFLKGKLAKSFPIKINNGGANAGNNNNAGANGGSSGSGAIGKPKNIDELSKIVNDTSIPLADRQKAMAEFEATNK